MTKKPSEPLIAEELSIWGDTSDSELPPDAPDRDFFWVEGYSDKRREFELAAASGERPKPLKWRLQYVSVEAPNRMPDGRKEMQFRAMGYVPIPFDRAADYGIDSLQSGFIKGPDGTCRVGSQMLMACPAEKAAVHARKQRDATKRLSEGSAAKLEGAIEDFNRRRSPSKPATMIREESVEKDRG